MSRELKALQHQARPVEKGSRSSFYVPVQQLPVEIVMRPTTATPPLRVARAATTLWPGAFGLDEIAGVAQQGVVRLPAQEAADSEDVHRSYTCLASWSSAVRTTSLARAGSPFGSGLFQLTPNLSRSIVVSRLRP